MIYLYQDITTVTGPAIILHGVNCQGVMGAGVAKDISDKWPKVKERFLAFPASSKNLGHINIILVDDDIAVFNCYTQEFYGQQKKKYASPGAINECLIRVAVLRVMAGKKGLSAKIYTPKIGCGLGGLDWDTEVEPIFKATEDRFGIKFNICEI